MDWQNELYNGLVQESGKTPKVASGNITKPNHEYQISDHSIPSLDVVANNDRNRKLKSKSKMKFSVHRALSFLPQE